jgi:hypothetical protein
VADSGIFTFRGNRYTVARRGDGRCIAFRLEDGANSVIEVGSFSVSRTANGRYEPDQLYSSTADQNLLLSLARFVILRQLVTLDD